MWASVHPPQCSSVFWELPGSKEARLPLGGKRVHHLEMLLLLNSRGNAVSSCCCSLFHWLKLAPAPSGFPAKGSPQNKAFCAQDQSHSQMLLTLLMCHLSAPILEFLSSHEHALQPPGNGENQLISQQVWLHKCPQALRVSPLSHHQLGKSQAAKVS